MWCLSLYYVGLFVYLLLILASYDLYFSLSCSLFNIMNIDILIVINTFISNYAIHININRRIINTCSFFSLVFLSSNQILSSQWEDLQQYIILINIYKSFKPCVHIDIFIRSIFSIYKQCKYHFYFYLFLSIRVNNGCK